MFSSFKGGIRPPEKKDLTANKAFVNLSVPHKCFFPLRQHAGKPARPLVRAGDMVQEGQMIASADGAFSANIHSSIPGKVLEITETWSSYSGEPVIVIEAEGEFSTSAKPLPAGDWHTMSREQLLERIRNAGVVGLGGEAYPTSLKLTPDPEKKIELLVVNAAESEPYLTAGDMLLQRFPEEILEGTAIVLKILGIDKAVIGIQSGKKPALKAVTAALQAQPAASGISVSRLPAKYPAGGEKQLIYCLTRKKVPSGRGPADVGTVVLNAATVYALREAVVLNKPFFERFITVSGAMIGTPGNYKVRVGMLVSDIIEECGGLKGDPARIVMGGPFRGTAVSSPDVPVIKGTSALLFLSEREAGPTAFRACIRCGKCIRVCPARLMPCELAAAVECGRFDLAAELHPGDCIHCGACDYVCPSRRPIDHYIHTIREKLAPDAAPKGMPWQ